MKIVVTHSSNFDFKNDLYVPLRNSELSNEHNIYLPQESGYEEVTKDRIKNCELVIAEVSHSSTGQGIELGWADIFEIPIVCIYKKGSKTSRSLSKITNNFIEFENSEDLISKLTGYIKSLPHPSATS